MPAVRLGLVANTGSGATDRATDVEARLRSAGADVQLLPLTDFCDGPDSVDSDRLDLMDTHARAAAEAGVGIVVSTDAHRVHELANLELGVYQARRGWLTKEQVVNTRPWPEVRGMLKS